jgi:diadenosine tetraphosphate (Ap4A) HIT family hydrolase
MTGQCSIPNSCVFCREAAVPGYANSFLGYDWPYTGRILYENEWTFVVPGYGPQVFPYSLVISKRHFVALSEATPLEVGGVLDSLKFLCNLLELKSLVVFEHSGCQNLESCVEHFHLHTIDPKFDLSWALADLPKLEVKFPSEAAFSLPGPYLLAGRFENDVIRGVVSPVKDKRDQFFRRALAELVDDKEWDWRLGMHPEFMLKLMNLASNKRSRFCGK